MLSSRLDLFIKHLGITPYAFESTVGVSKGSISKPIENHRTIGSEAIGKIFDKYPDLNLEWLIAGKGEMFKNIVDKSHKNDLLDKVTSKKTLSTPSSMEVKDSEVIYDDPVRNPGSVPFYESDAFGGPVPVFNDTPEVPSTYIYFPGFEDCSFALRASGDSMEDKIHAGDIIACKEIQNKNIISYGDMYLVITKEHRLIKIIRRGAQRNAIILRSYNKDYDDIDLMLEDVLGLYLIKGVIKKTQI